MQLIQTQHLTMSSREIADLTEKRHDHVMRDIRNMFAELGITDPSLGGSYIDSTGRTLPCFNLPRREVEILLTGYSIPLRAKVIDRLHELEAQQSRPKELTRLELIQMMLEAEQEKLLLQSERDTAVATKAEIGSRREATAMNTASQATKKVSALEQELDRSKEYFTIKRMSMIHHGQPFNWRLLKAASAEMGIPAIGVFDQNYGSVLSYHVDVWREVYSLEMEG